MLPQHTDKRATLTFDQLRDGIRQYYRRIRAIEVEYNETVEVAPFDAAAKGSIPKGEHHFASKGEKRMASQSFPPRGKPDATAQ